MRNPKLSGFIVIALIAGIVYTAFFGISAIGIKGANQMRYGIDIRGGVEALYVPVDYNPSQEELSAARRIMETRLDAKNITDREVTIDRQNSAILIRFPWKSNETEFDAQAAISELGETAHLTFRDPQNNIILEGKNVKKASPQQNTQQQKSMQNLNQSKFVVQLELDDEGALRFAEATRRLTGQNIGIYMDEIQLTNPKVEQEITGGSAIITGMESMDAARELAEKINAGALPFTMVSKNNSTISPTLGQNALGVMLNAAIIAFILICLFMLLYYRLPGFVACIALSLQVAGQLLALSVPQFTLTLPGIAAIILSIGMGVDANVIVSERIREEIKAGKTLKGAIDSGFHKAFSSVFDGNITVIIVAIILMIFGSGSILSFGYSLLTGVLLNFVAGISATRIMIRAFSSSEILRHPALYNAGGKKK